MFDSFFQGTVFLCFTKSVAAMHSLTDTVFISEQHLQPLIVYIQFTWQIFLFKAYCNFKGAHAAIHLSGTTIISGSHLQGPSIFKGTVFLWMRTCNRLCFQRYRVNLSPVASIHSTNGPFSIIKEQLQPQVLSNLPHFFRTGRVVARRYYNYQL